MYVIVSCKKKSNMPDSNTNLFSKMQDKEHSSVVRGGQLPSNFKKIMWRMSFETRGSAASSVVIVRELQETSSCDDFNFSFKELRDSFKKKMTAEAFQNVITYQTTHTDVDRAAQAVAHYRLWTKKCLYNGLSFTNKIWYHTVLRWDRFMSWFTGAVVLVGARR